MSDRAISSTFSNAGAPVPEMIIRVVGKDGTYGVNGVHVNDKDDPVIEFYDPRHRHSQLEDGLRGQFISRYRMSALEGHHGDLDLNGGVRDWVLSDYGFDEAMRSARTANETLRNDENTYAM